MTASKWFMEAAPQVLRGVDGAYEEAFNAVLEGAGGLEDADSSFIQIAYAHKPDTITPQDYIVRNPYTNPEKYKADMAASAERGWIKAVGEGQYTISDKGAEVVERLLGTLNEGAASIESLPEAELQRIHDLLQKVVDKAHKLPEPAEKWGMAWGKRFQKALVVEGAPTLVRVRRRIIDMFALRDDGHVAAWKAVEKDGQIWETLALVVSGDAGTAAELVEKLPYRNYDEGAYAVALEKLAERGWIEQENGKYVATAKGSELRQEVEDATDRYFDAPWVALGKAEAEETRSLMEKLAQAIKPPEEQESA